MKDKFEEVIRSRNLKGNADNTYNDQKDKQWWWTKHYTEN
jgi:hypothetical protein